MKKALILGVILVFFGISASGCGSKANEEKTQNDQKESFVETSLKEIAMLNKTMKCDLSIKDDISGGAYKQTMYIDGNQYRIDTEIEFNQPEMEKISYHMISDGENIYTWNEGQKTGLKMNIVEMSNMGEEYKENADLAEAGKIDLEQKFDFNCQPWSKDAGTLNPPSNIEFNDYLKQIKSFTESLENMDFSNISADDLCSLCDQENSEAERLNCLEEMGC